jgi:hypothetical protein
MTKFSPSYSNDLFRENRNVRYFINFFKTKKKVNVRPGALQPDEVEKLVKEIGKGKKVNIRRVEYDGAPEDTPFSLRIVDIREDHFIGSIVNVERSIKQENDEKLVYVKGGGGTLEFFFADGDILSIEEDVDETIFEERNVDELLEILDALDLNESILLSYYDEKKAGVINCVGKLIEKDLDVQTFSVELNQINEIELDTTKTIKLNLNSDKVLDLEVML